MGWLVVNPDKPLLTLALCFILDSNMTKLVRGGLGRLGIKEKYFSFTQRFLVDPNCAKRCDLAI